MAGSKALRFILYANGNFGKNCLASFVEIYGLFYLTEVLDLAPAVAGGLLLASLVWDAITDPLAGYAADRLTKRWSTILPYAALGAPLTAIAFLTLFHPGAAAKDLGVLGIFAALLIFRTAYTIFDVPHNGLLAYLPDTGVERTNLASLRIFFSALGKLCMTSIAAILLSAEDSEELGERFAAVSGILAVLFLASVAFSALSVRRVPFGRGQIEGSAVRLRDVVTTFATNRNLVIIFILTAMNSLITPVIGVSLIYYAKYALGDEAVGARAVTWLAATQAISLVAWAWLTNISNAKKSAAIAAYIGLSSSAMVTAFFGSSPLMLMAGAAAAGFALSGVFMLSWSMLPDALETPRDLDQPMCKAVLSVFGLYTLTNKAFHGLSQAYVGVILSLYGVQAGEGAEPATFEDVRRFLLLLPALGALMATAVLRTYRSDPAGS